jgi:BNR repeat-like domain
MSQENVEVVRRFFEAIARAEQGDTPLDTMQRLADDDVVYVEDPKWPGHDTYRGQELSRSAGPDTTSLMGVLKRLRGRIRRGGLNSALIAGVVAILVGSTTVVAAVAAAGGAMRLGRLVQVTDVSHYPAACASTRYRDAEVEFSLAANRDRPRQLVGAWIQEAPRSAAVSYSRNGGRSWHPVVPPALADCTGSDYVRSSDPWLSVGPGGVAYLSTLPVANSAGSGLGPAPAVQVSRSPDTGRSWSRPVFVERRSGPVLEWDDKPTVTADPYRRGHVYASWGRQHVQTFPEGTFIFYRVEFSSSRDGGRTWSSPITVDTPPAGWSENISQILVPWRGELLCVFTRRELGPNRALPLPGGRVDFYASRSRDGGRTWSTPRLLAQGRELALEDAERSTRIRSAVTHVFTAASGPRRRVYVSWADVLSGDASRIMLVRSRDGGRSWSHPRSVSRGAERPMNPDLAVAGNGAVAVRFYDLRPEQPGDGTLSTRSWVRVSRNGWQRWRERALGGVFDLRTAPVASADNPGRFLGEYQGIVGLPTGFGTLFAQAQPQARFGPTDGFFRRIRSTRGRKGGSPPGR